MESHRRSIAKAISYRLFGSLTTFIIAWYMTGQFSTGLNIGLIDGVAKLFAYFAHERVWARVKYGVPKPPEYEI